MEAEVIHLWLAQTAVQVEEAVGRVQTFGPE